MGDGHLAAASTRTKCCGKPVPTQMVPKSALAVWPLPAPGGHASRSWQNTPHKFGGQRVWDLESSSYPKSNLRRKKISHITLPLITILPCNWNNCNDQIILFTLTLVNSWPHLFTESLTLQPLCGYAININTLIYWWISRIELVVWTFILTFGHSEIPIIQNITEIKNVKLIPNHNRFCSK